MAGPSVTDKKLNKTQAFKRLLQGGYFPKELPPPFSTSSLGKKSDKLEKAFAQLIEKMPARERANHPKPARLGKFDMARRGHSRRMLSIVNPVNQYYICKFIAENLQKISISISKSSYSITNAQISAGEGRAVPLPPFATLPERRIKLYAPYNYIVETDVSAFYHAIYTHSIPWALHGKDVAKTIRDRNDANVFGNQLDFLVRQSQDGQTKGIPVGPDTSRIISEIILSSVDVRIEQRVGRLIRAGYRYIDDMFYCFDSHSEGNECLSAIREELMKYELELNSVKTKLRPSHAFNEETWPHEVNLHRISKSENKQIADIISFFSSVIEISSRNPGESIAVYAVKISTQTFIKKDCWPVYEAFLVRIAREHPNTFDLVVKIICTYAALGYQVSPSVPLLINSAIINGSRLGHHFEVSWALWLAISLRLPVSEEAVAELHLIENAVCNILSLHCVELQLIDTDFSSSAWASASAIKSLRDENWLLIYECGCRSWISGSADQIVDSDPFFHEMKDLGVRFFDPKATNRPIGIPGIESKLRFHNSEKKLKLLPGNIKPPPSVRSGVGQYTEEVGGDYGDDDNSPWGDVGDWDNDGPGWDAFGDDEI